MRRGREFSVEISILLKWHFTPSSPAFGRTRIALTDDERAGRELVVEWMRELDLDVQVDRIGNILGTLRSASGDGSERPLMMGSHIDTVTNAGALDGCYGVLAGLAVERAFRRAGRRMADAIAWPTKNGAVRR